MRRVNDTTVLEVPEGQEELTPEPDALAPSEALDALSGVGETIGVSQTLAAVADVHGLVSDTKEREHPAGRCSLGA